MRRFGKYDVIEKIGEGGFGVVYEGFDPQIRRRVAIKTCTSEDSTARSRFYREAEIAGNLHHRNITIVYDAGEESGVPYMVQEYLTGEDLDRKIRRKDALSFAAKLLYLMQIASGLEYAHAQGIVHLDIKPSNIRILDDGLVKIMDFGIARMDSESDTLTLAGETIGTAAYLAPEQVRGAKVGLRADIHAFGVIGFELLTGRRAFPGIDPNQVMRRVLDERPPPVSELWPQCPQPLEKLIARCCSKEAEDRYPSFLEVIEELEAMNQSPSAWTSPAPAPDSPHDEDLDALTTQPHAMISESPSLEHMVLAGKAPETVRHARQARPSARAKLVRYLLVPVVMALLGGGAVFWFQRDLSLEELSRRLHGLPPTAGAETATPFRPAPSDGATPRLSTPNPGDDSSSSGASNITVSSDGTASLDAGDTPPSGPASTSSQPASPTATSSAAKPTRAFGTLIIEPGWNPAILVSVSNQPAVRLDVEKRFRLEPDVDHYLEFSLVDGDYRAAVSENVRVNGNGETRIRSPIPGPAGLTIRAALRAPQVFVRCDGKALGWTPVQQRALAPGPHMIDVWSSSSTVGKPLQSLELELRSNRLRVVTFDTRRLEPPIEVERGFDP